MVVSWLYRLQIGGEWKIFPHVALATSTANAVKRRTRNEAEAPPLSKNVRPKRSGGGEAPVQ
jgi:hypothetical protein